MDKKEVLDLIRRYNDGSCTEQEQELLEIWYLSQELAPAGELAEPDLEQDLQEVFSSLPKPAKKIKMWYRLSAAAVALLIVGAGLLFIRKQVGGRNQEIFVRSDIKPGGQRATITLENGENIDLEQARQGLLSRKAGLIINKTATGQVVCKLDPDAKEKTSSMTITTPKGGIYTLELPDGTRIWLNAASSLKYLPVKGGSPERRVTLRGEAYFEVAKDKAHPFFVETAHQEVKVLGTHFNISAYDEDPSTRTTLLEGSVLVHGPVQGLKSVDNQAILVPGQQASLTPKDLKIGTADFKETLAWKNGYFIFNEETLGSIMQKVSRWYNIDVVFKDDLEKTSFIGVISRSKNLASVLQLLQETGNVHFKMEGRSVIVMK